MKAEIAGDRLTIDVGPGERQAALDTIAAYFRVRETERTRRYSIIAATASDIVAAVTVVFVPQGTEVWARWISGALVVFGLCAGVYGLFLLKTRLPELKAPKEDAQATKGGADAE